jgi:hypothetical protein
VRVLQCAAALALTALAVLLSIGTNAALAAPAGKLNLPVQRWRLVEEKSGPVNYYKMFKNASPPYLRGEYRPGLKTAVLGFQLADEDRARAKKLSWRWRAITLPKGGDECVEGKGDSAAVIYVTWRRGLRWYTLKYVWTASSTKGAVCAKKRNPFVAQDTIVLRSGGPLNEWHNEEIDLKAEFRKHFEGGDPEASVPDLLGVGLMTDGDQTKSPSVGDYADFVLTR